MAGLSVARARQEFFTARELAEVAATRGIARFPGTERGVRLLAEREGWNELPVSLARMRRGAEGGRPTREYHVSLLPEFLRTAVAASEVWAPAAVEAHELVAETAQRCLVAVRGAALGPRARAVMEARAEILLAIDGFAVAKGQTRAWAVAEFLAALDLSLACQDIGARSAAGEILTAREAAVLTAPKMLTAATGFGLALDKLVQANDRRDNARVSRRTLYDWFRQRDAQGVVALAPVATKTVQPIPPAFGEFLAFYARPSKPSVTDAYASYLAEAGKRQGAQPMTLTLDQVRHILRVKLNNIEKHIGREGILTLRSRLPYIQRQTEDLLPTTIYTADGKTFDAEVADPVSRRAMRPEITSVLDVATRKCVGFAVSRKENVIAVTEALRRSCASHGICAIFYTDRGPGYKNKTFDADVGGLMGRLGIAKMHALPYNSQAKGIIERFNAQWNTLAKRLPTYIGEDMDKEAGQRIHKLTRREIGEAGFSRYLPSWQDFLVLCEEMVASYNAAPHRGLPRFEDPQTGRLRHMSPDEAWAAHVQNGFEAVMIAPEDEDDLFRPYEIRVVRRALVEWNTNQYFHPDLEAWHERQVMVGYDLHQADRVWVRAFDLESGQPGALICVAEFSGNKVGYVPKTVEARAIEQRRKGQHKRLDDKRETIDAQVAAPFIEHGPVGPALAFSVVDPAPVAQAELVSVAPAAPRRRVFASDEELALWALAHPSSLNRNQINVLQGCMASETARDLLRMAGVDLDALRNLLRAVA